MRPHQAAHPHWPLIREYSPSPGIIAFFLVFKLVTYLLTQPNAACTTQAVAFIHLSQVSWPTEISIGISLHLTANRL